MYLTSAGLFGGSQAASLISGAQAALFIGGAQAASFIAAHNFLGWGQEESIGRVGGYGWLSRDLGVGWEVGEEEAQASRL